MKRILGMYFDLKDTVKPAYGKNGGPALLKALYRHRQGGFASLPGDVAFNSQIIRSLRRLVADRMIQSPQDPVPGLFRVHVWVIISCHCVAGIEHCGLSSPVLFSALPFSSLAGAVSCLFFFCLCSLSRFFFSSNAACEECRS